MHLELDFLCGQVEQLSFSITSDISFCIRMEQKDLVSASSRVNVLHLGRISATSCAI